jgi:hypothetical protein
MDKSEVIMSRTSSAVPRQKDRRKLLAEADFNPAIDVEGKHSTEPAVRDSVEPYQIVIGRGVCSRQGDLSPGHRPVPLRVL